MKGIMIPLPAPTTTLGWSTIDMPSETERRRYALLQAAATLMASEYPVMAKEAVEDAADLLAEIERREKESA